MSVAKVRADYERLAQVAQKFGKQAETAGKMLAALQSRMNVLEGGDWVGKGAKVFYAEMNSAVLPAMKRVVGAMKSAANTTTKISRIMQQAEEDATALFRLDGTGTVTQVGGTGALDDVQAGNVSALRRPGPDGGGSGASGGGSGQTQGGGGAPAPAKPKGQPATKDKPPKGSDRYQGTPAQDDYVADKWGKAIDKFRRQQGATLEKTRANIINQLKLAHEIAELQGKPEYQVRRAEFFKGHKKWVLELDEEYQQTVRNVTGAKTAYEAAKDALEAKPPEQVTLDDVANVEIMRSKMILFRDGVLPEMKAAQDAYAANAPRLPP